ncbi:MAG: GGDEF domain-containing protein [Actinomycetota bacterium]
MELLRERYYLGVDQSAIAGLVTVATIIAMLWTRSSPSGLMLWAWLMLVALPTPSILKRRELPVGVWLRILAPYEALLGAMWGLVAVVAMPAAAEWQALLGAILVAILLASSVTSSQFTRAYLSFTGTFVALCLVGYGLHGVGSARLFLWVFLVSWVYGIVQAHELRKLQLDLVYSLEHNRSLVATLAEANAAANAANEQLAMANEQLAAAGAESERLARTDPLTQLPNRMAFEEEVERRLAALGGSDRASVTLAFIDLDEFKLVNDSLGHRSGDLLLIGVARRLVAICEPAEAVFRLGGDELMLLSDSSKPAGLGRRILSVFDEPFVLDGESRAITGSVGIATTAAPLHRDEVLRWADAAQYTTKRSGGGGYTVAHPASDASPAIDDREAQRNSGASVSASGGPQLPGE